MIHHPNLKPQECLIGFITTPSKHLYKKCISSLFLSNNKKSLPPFYLKYELQQKTIPFQHLTKYLKKSFQFTLGKKYLLTLGKKLPYFYHSIK